MTAATHSAVTGRESRSRRSRAGAEAVFPVPSRRLAVVRVGGAGTTGAVERMAKRLQWSFIHVADSDRMEWALTVNRPVVTVVVGSGDLTDTRNAVRRARQAVKCPIVLLEDLTGPQTVTMLAAGADNVLPRHICDEELGGRLPATVRRSAEGSDSGARYLVHRELRVDLWRKEVTLQHRPLPLTGTEYRLLVSLMEASGQAVAVNRILYCVWNWATPEGVITLRSTIARLRRKPGDTARAPGSSCRSGGTATGSAAV